MRKLVLGAATLALLSCGGSSNAIYIRAVTATASAPSGTNCASTTNGVTTTLTNEGGLADMAIYLTPTNPSFTCSGPCNAVLDLGLGGIGLLNGSQSGSSYSFSGEVIDDAKGTSQEVIYEDQITVTLTVNGNAVSGSLKELISQTCQNGCSGFNDSSCTSSAPFQGTVIPGIEDETTLGGTSSNN